MLTLLMKSDRFVYIIYYFKWNMDVTQELKMVGDCPPIDVGCTLSLVFCGIHSLSTIFLFSFLQLGILISCGYKDSTDHIL